MLHVKLNDFISLNGWAEKPGIFSLHFNEGYSHTSISLIDFFTHLPIQFNHHTHFSKKRLHGFGFYYHQLGFVIDPGANKYDLFKNASYSRWDELESDVKLANPDYPFIKKSGDTLNDAHRYLMEACKNLTIEEIVQNISNMNDPIYIDDFLNNFYCFEKEQSRYIISYRNIKQVKPLYHLFSNDLDEYPTYLLQGKNSKQTIVYLKDENFHFIHLTHEQFDFKKIASDNIEELVGEMESFHFDAEELHIEKLSSAKVSNFLVTTANLIAKNISYEDDIKELRNFFRVTFNIKARGKEELWNKGVEALKNDPFTLEKPIYLNMQNSVFNLVPFHDEDVADLLFENKDVRMAAYFKLFSHLHSNVISDDFDVNENYENLIKNNVSLYKMPDYGEIADNSEDFNELIK
jgi:hypothetical protein